LAERIRGFLADLRSYSKLDETTLTIISDSLYEIRMAVTDLEDLATESFDWEPRHRPDTPKRGSKRSIEDELGEEGDPMRRIGQILSGSLTKRIESMALLEVIEKLEDMTRRRERERLDHNKPQEDTIPYETSTGQIIDLSPRDIKELEIAKMRNENPKPETSNKVDFMVMGPDGQVTKLQITPELVPIYQGMYGQSEAER